MRIDRLDIIRYGALTDRALDFRADAKLHLIYGPNEAGKSSALSAISDLLFGFPRTAAHYSFLHDPASLRIGATVTAHDGARLAFRRRRGAKNTLLAADEKEATLPDDALAPYLRHLSRDVFERAFGLNSDRLRAGAATMLKSGGEIGSLLFSAASGLTGLSRLRQSLESDADGIYAARRSKERSFYQVLDRHDEARKAEREHELKSVDWKKLVAEAAELDAEIDGLQKARHDTKQSLDRLQRLKTLQPLVTEIDGEQAALLGFADLPSFPPSFERELDEALAAVRTTHDALQAAQAEQARLADELEAAHVDETLLAAVGAILVTYAGKGAYLKAKQDLPGVRREVEDFDLKLAQLGRRLGQGDAPDEIEQRQPADMLLARLHDLVAQGRELKRSGEDVRGRLEEEREALRRLEGSFRSGRVIDPKPYADQLMALQPEIAEISRLDTLRVKAERGRSELDAAVGRLSPAVTDLDRLLASPLPDAAMLAEQRKLIEEAQVVARGAAARLADLERERSELARELATLEEGGEIATRAQVVTARAARDELLREAEKTSATERSVRFDALGRAVREADRLADLMHLDAERVSRHSQISLQSTALEEKLAHAIGVRDETAAALAVKISAFKAMFETSGVVPLDAERMVEWRRAIDALAKQRETLHAIEDDLTALERQGQRLLPALMDLAAATGLSVGGLPLSVLHRTLSRHVAEIGERWAESRSADGKRISIADSLARLEERETAIRADAERWQADFADTAAAAGLPEAVTVDMAEVALNIWKDLPNFLSERENRRRRVRGMERDVALFEGDVRELVARLAPDLGAMPVDGAVDVLHGRAVAAAADLQRRAGLIDAAERAETRFRHRLTEASAADVALSHLAKMAPAAADLVLLLQRLRERRDLETRLSACRNRFLLQSDGWSEPKVRGELAAFDRVAADLEIERLVGKDARQVTRYGELTAAAAENLRRREALEAGVSAERAAFERLAAEQEAKDLARQWVVLRIASHMLGQSMEAYRERQTDPVMLRAGAHFSRLTGGRFARLAQDYGADDELQLLAERACGERVPLGGLSEGTADQLYLALRLAFLEDYSGRNEPAPLIVDDIFQTFDDERTAAGLGALAGTAERFQTILFTHEASVVEIARQEVGSGLDLLRL